MSRRSAAEGGAPTPWAFSVGRLGGIPIRIHATFLFLLVWIGTRSAERGDGFFAGVVFLLLLFACVVLHELGHATMARRYGVVTSEIVLYPIGGIARLDKIPAGKAELWIALAGPAVNVVLAGLMYGVLQLLPGESAASPSQLLDDEPSVPRQLFWSNVALVVFNMIPAFPMDGGRVLRAALSLGLGQERATRIAARVGQAMAIGLAVVATVVFEPVNPVLLLIAFFVFLGAGQEAAYETRRAAIHGFSAREAMVTRFETLAPQDTLDRAAQLLVASHQHDFPVVDAWGRVAGVLHRSALLEALAKGGRETAVLEAMEREFVSVSPETPLEEVLGLFRGRPSHPILVLGASGGLEGMITLDNFGELIEISRRTGSAS
jgi:Zn-dependent protease/predicted transcriptional regulator